MGFDCRGIHLPAGSKGAVKKSDEDSDVKSHKFFSITERSRNGKDIIVYLTKGIVIDDVPALSELLRTANKEDKITIHINCPGGEIYPTLQILNAIEASQAELAVVADGQVGSASAFIFLAIKNRTVLENAFLFIHYYSGMSAGKGNEQRSHVEFHDDFMKALFNNYATGFLTETELDMMFRGTDYYFNAGQIRERLKRLDSAKNEDKEQKKKK